MQFLIYIAMGAYFWLDDVSVPEWWSDNQKRGEVIATALECSLSKEAISRAEDFRFSRVEQALYLLYLDWMYQQEGLESEAARLMLRFLNQIKGQVQEKEECCFRYAHAVAVVVRRLPAGISEVVNLCFGVIKLLQQEKKLYCMTTLINYILESDGVEEDGEFRSKARLREWLNLLKAMEAKFLPGYEKFAENGWRQSQALDFVELARPNFQGMPMGGCGFGMHVQRRE